jgi:hypothetical protein
LGHAAGAGQQVNGCLRDRDCWSITDASTAFEHDWIERFGKDHVRSGRRRQQAPSGGEAFDIGGVDDRDLRRSDRCY